MYVDLSTYFSLVSGVMILVFNWCWTVMQTGACFDRTGEEVLCDCEWHVQWL